MNHSIRVSLKQRITQTAHYSSRVSLKQSITQACNHSSRKSFKQCINQAGYHSNKFLYNSLKKTINEWSFIQNLRIIQKITSLKNTKSLKHLVLFDPRWLNHSNKYLDTNYYSSLSMLSVDLWPTYLNFSWWHDAECHVFLESGPFFNLCESTEHLLASTRNQGNQLPSGHLTNLYRNIVTKFSNMIFLQYYNIFRVCFNIL